MKVHVVVLWVVTPPNGGSIVFRSGGILPHHYMVSKPRTLWHIPRHSEPYECVSKNFWTESL